MVKCDTCPRYKDSYPGKSNLPVDGLVRLLDLLGYELEIRRRR